MQKEAIQKDTPMRDIEVANEKKILVKKQTDKLLGAVQDMINRGDFNAGVFSNIWQEAGEYLTGELGMLDKEQADKIVENAGVRAEYQKIFSEWLRALSGTAASEKEVARVMQQMGFNTWKDEKTMLAGLQKFNELIGKDVRYNASMLGDFGYSEIAKTHINSIGPVRSMARAKNPDTPTTTSAAGGVPVDDLVKAPKLRAAVLKAPDGTEVKYQGKLYIKKGNELFPKTEGGK